MLKKLFSPRADANKPVVLFVDDEENVLHGLKRLLRSRRGVWTMEFMTSAAAALDFLSKTRADVIVSDMRMPQMDGAEFLANVRDRYPDTVRIVLSGYSAREAVLKTIGPSHRYLAKPCTENALLGAIESSLRLRAILKSENVKKAVAGLSHLPTLPRTYAEILNEMSAEFASAESLSKKVERDIAISAQLLKITNSAYFGVPRNVATVKQAVQFLGFDNVRAIVVMAGIFEQFKGISSDLAVIAETLSDRSLRIAMLSQAIARSEALTPTEVDDAFCAGLLMHIGTLLLIANSSDHFRTAMAELDKGERAIEDVEREAFGASHAELGAYLLNLWGFNDQIVEAVAHHHRPGACDSRDGVLTAVHGAQYLLRDVASNDAELLRHREPLDKAYLVQANVADKVGTWRGLCNSLIKGWADG